MHMDGHLKVPTHIQMVDTYITESEHQATQSESLLT